MIRHYEIADSFGSVMLLTKEQIESRYGAWKYDAIMDMTDHHAVWTGYECILDEICHPSED